MKTKIDSQNCQVCDEAEIYCASSCTGRKQSPTHTPTPWVSSTIIQRGFLYQEIVGPTKDGHRGIAKVYLGKPNTIIEPQNEANAAFIVRAVNEYEALKAENGRLLNAHEELISLLRLLRHRENLDDSDREAIGQAIAKAEGK